MTMNEEKALKFAENLYTKNGVIVNSGTIAILSALKLSNLRPGANVLINGYCCYSLFEAIKVAGYNPIFLIPKNFFNISIEEIQQAMNKYKIDCFIAAHQYGLVQDIKIIKEKFPNLIIIEDIAQAWNIKENDIGIGAYSDYVVTSFGKSKPLSYGQAGAIFSKENIQEHFDFHDKNSRQKNHILLPFALYECDSIQEDKLIKNANMIVNKQREISKYLSEYFQNNDNIEVFYDSEDQQSVWQKFPVIIKNPEYARHLEKILNENNILYQWQNEEEVWELGMVKDYNCEIIKNSSKPKYILIRTRQNEIENVKKLIRRK